LVLAYGAEGFGQEGLAAFLFNENHKKTKTELAFACIQLEREEKFNLNFDTL
jgi:hypothetical protein